MACEWYLLLDAQCGPLLPDCSSLRARGEGGAGVRCAVSGCRYPPKKGPMTSQTSQKARKARTIRDASSTICKAFMIAFLFSFNSSCDLTLRGGYQSHAQGLRLPRRAGRCCRPRIRVLHRPGGEIGMDPAVSLPADDPTTDWADFISSTFDPDSPPPVIPFRSRLAMVSGCR